MKKLSEGVDEKQIEAEWKARMRRLRKLLD